MSKNCCVCKGPVLCYPEEGPAYCTEHCPGHDYVYDLYDGRSCSVCAKPSPMDEYIWDDPT